MQAEACRHPNVSLVVLDGNVDVAKQNNDVRDLLARGVDGIVMSPVESAGLVPAARAVMDAGLPLVLLDRDVPSEKTLFIGQSNVTMAEQVAERMAKDLGGKGNDRGDHRPAGLLARRSIATRACRTCSPSIPTSRCW